jgi:hypothetical protein
MTTAQQVLVPKVGMIRTRKMGELVYKNDTRLGSFSEAEYRGSSPGAPTKPSN